MEFSPLQCTGKVGDKVRNKSRKSAAQIMKVGNMFCVADFHCVRWESLTSRGKGEFWFQSLQLQIAVATW